MKNFFSIKKLLLVTSLSTICFVSCNSCGEDNPDSKEDTKLQQKTKSNNSKKYEKPKLVPENKNEKQSLNYQTQQTTNKQTQQPSNKKKILFQRQNLNLNLITLVLLIRKMFSCR